MAVVSPKPFVWPFISEIVSVEVNDVPIEADTLSVSGDGSVYSEETQIAKAARIEEPERPQWLAKSELLANQHASSPRKDASSVYNVSGWSEGYFEVTEDGHLAVKPQGGKPATDEFPLPSRC